MTVVISPSPNTVIDKQPEEELHTINPTQFKLD